MNNVVTFPGKEAQNTTLKSKPFSVTVEWSESSDFDEGETIDFKEFESRAYTVALNHAGRGYLKTKIIVTFEDGDQYGCRIDLAAGDELGFTDHIKQIIDFFINDQEKAVQAWGGYESAAEVLEAINKMDLNFKPVELKRKSAEKAEEIAKAKSQQAEAEEEAAQKAAYEQEKTKFKTSEEYAHLKQAKDFTKCRTVEIAANMRAELKKQFPGVKFSVRKGSYSSIYVKWTDGPTTEQVDLIVQRHKSGNFNGMTDCYDFHGTPFSDVFGSVQYIFTSRDYSEKATSQAIDQVFAKYESNLKDHKKPTVEELQNGDCNNVYFIEGDRDDLRDYIYQAQRKIDFYEKPQPKKRAAKKAQEKPSEASQANNEQSEQLTLNFECQKLDYFYNAEKNRDQYVVNLVDHVEYETFKQVLAVARRFGGWYSKYNKNGHKKGFQFKCSQTAKQFINELEPKEPSELSKLEGIKSKYNVTISKTEFRDCKTISIIGDHDWLEVIEDLKTFYPSIELGKKYNTHTTYNIEKPTTEAETKQEQEKPTKPHFKTRKIAGVIWAVDIIEGENVTNYQPIEALTQLDAIKKAWAMHTNPNNEPPKPSRKNSSLGDFNARQEAKAERATERAAKAQTQAQALHQQADHFSQRFWGGEPIKIGHHSEKRHRRDLDKLHNMTRKSIEADKKAQHYQRKATSAGRAGIASDDAQAIDKLKNKLEKLEANQNTMKAINQIQRSKQTDAEKLAEVEKLGLSKTAAGMVLNKNGFQDWQLQNNKAEIRRTKKRIEELEKLHNAAPIEKTGHGWEMCEHNGRICLYFDAKPEKPTCKTCRSYGFTYSRTLGAWVRKITTNAVYSAEQLANELNTLESL